MAEHLDYALYVTRVAEAMGLTEHQLFELAREPWFSRAYSDALHRIIASEFQIKGVAA